MKRVEGTNGAKLIECVNPVKDRWRVRWDVQSKDDGSANYMEAEFVGRPSADAIKATVTGWYNEQTDAKILSGFVYGDDSVWLSSENQFNYKAAYDLAVQSGGATLPVKFKLGTDESPAYRTFSTIDELTDFFTKAMTHIQNTLAEGWKKKDSFNLKDYE